MDPDKARDIEIVKFFKFISVVLIVISLIILLTTYLSIKETGGLKVTSSKGATLMLTQSNHRPTLIGTSNANVRVTPGSYTVYASTNRTQTGQSVTIVKGQTTIINLPVSTKAATTQQTKNTEANNFIKQLPIIGPASEFEINYQYKINNNVAEPIIVISGINQQAQADGLQWIKNLGYNPNDFTIVYQTENVTNYHPTN